MPWFGIGVMHYHTPLLTEHIWGGLVIEWVREQCLPTGKVAPWKCQALLDSTFNQALRHCGWALLTVLGSRPSLCLGPAGIGTVVVAITVPLMAYAKKLNIGALSPLRLMRTIDMRRIASPPSSRHLR
jgi:hypothetical protein